MWTHIEWWFAQISPIKRKLIEYARRDGHRLNRYSVRATFVAGGRHSSTKSVNAMANTASENASTRVVVIAESPVWLQGEEL
jgi:hypothetical protein